MTGSEAFIRISKLVDELKNVVSRELLVPQVPADAESTAFSPTPPQVISEMERRNARYRMAAHREYAARRKREKFFNDLDIFGEPGWDMLLDLYVSHCDGKRISVTSCCIASAGAPTTALRWLAVLENQGLITRQSDVADGRRAFVTLTSAAILRIERYLEATPRVL